MTADETREISGEIKRVERKVDNAARQAEQVARQNRLDWYRWLVLVVTAVLGPAIAIFVSATSQHRLESRLCAVVVSADNAWKATPPITDAGREQARNMAELRTGLGCPPRKVP